MDRKLGSQGEIHYDPRRSHTGSQGTPKITLGPGSIWLIADYAGEMAPGQPFTGHGIYGYDPVKNVHNSFWIDSTWPSRMIGEGACSDGCKKVTIHSEAYDPMQQKTVTFREVTEWKDNDHVNIQMYTPGMDGKEFLNLAIEYTRKKGGRQTK